MPRSPTYPDFPLCILVDNCMSSSYLSSFLNFLTQASDSSWVSVTVELLTIEVCPLHGHSFPSIEFLKWTSLCFWHVPVLKNSLHASKTWATIPPYRSLVSQDFPLNASFSIFISFISWLAHLLLGQKLTPVHEGKREMEERHRLVQIGKCYIQYTREFTYEACFGSHKMSASPHSLNS